MAKLVVKDEVLAREQLPNSCHLLFPRRDHFMSDGFQAFFSRALDVMYRARPRNVLPRVARLVGGWRDLLPIAWWQLQGTAHYPYLSRGGWAGLPDRGQLFKVFEMWSMYEQAPDAANRITLSQRRDYQGTPIIKVDWRFTEADREGVRRVRELVASELACAGIGKVSWHRDLFTAPSSAHPIGGARMGIDPRSSVVDPNLAIHGVPNPDHASGPLSPGLI